MDRDRISDAALSADALGRSVATLGALLADAPLRTWQGEVWRNHAIRYLGDSPAGSFKVSGRWHRGLDTAPAAESQEALYAALTRAVALAERMRHLTARTLPALATLRLSLLEVNALYVIDLRAGLRADSALLAAVNHDTDFRVAQAVGRAAFDRGTEGILVPSATQLGDNLVLYPSNFQRGTYARVIETIDPRLYVVRREPP